MRVYSRTHVLVALAGALWRCCNHPPPSALGLFACPPPPDHQVLKLESQVDKDSRATGVAAQSNLSMNQTLEGHNGVCVCTTHPHCLLAVTAAITTTTTVHASYG